MNYHINMEHGGSYLDNTLINVDRLAQFIKSTKITYFINIPYLNGLLYTYDQKYVPALYYMYNGVYKVPKPI